MPIFRLCWTYEILDLVEYIIFRETMKWNIINVANRPKPSSQPLQHRAEKIEELNEEQLPKLEHS